jgi:DNA-binding transcriptional ArsR family regulator
MGILQIASVGDDSDAVMVGVREYPVSRLVLLHTPDYVKQAEELQRTLTPLRLRVDLVNIDGDVMLDVLRTVGELVTEAAVEYDDVYVNVASGTRMLGCAATAASFVNGVKAFGIMDEKPFLLPVLKFSYHELVSDAKIRILRAISEAGEELDSLQTLSERTGLDKSLLSYHLRGGRESKGLENLGLVEIDRGVRGRLAIRLTPMGSMLLVGYAPAVSEEAR